MEEELFLLDQEWAVQAYEAISSGSEVCLPPASVLQVRLTPPDGCGFYDGLLILLLQLLTQVQLQLKAPGK